MGIFRSYKALSRSAQPGRDFVIEVRRGSSGIVVMAPHGGGIEPGTAAIADAIAGCEHGYYAFKGIRAANNRQLHISSIYFDEPQAMKMIRRCHTVVTIHGCRSADRVVYVGGLDASLKNRVSAKLNRFGFKAQAPSMIALRGEHRRNLCNRGRLGHGLQLEISTALRDLLTASGMETSFRPNLQLQSFANSVRMGLRSA